MEKIQFSKNVNQDYYLENEKAFAKVESIISLMPNFAVVNTVKYTNEDLYYETPDFLLKNLGDASIRIRNTANEKSLSIICNQNGTKREFIHSLDVNLEGNPFEDDSTLVFLEDKIRDIYAHRLDVDFIRKLKTLKVFMAVVTHRKEFVLINNSGTRVIVCLDTVEFMNKRRTETDYMLEIKLDCYPGKDNLFVYERFLKELNRKVVLIPAKETKYEAGLRIYKLVDLSKKELKAFKEERKLEKQKQDQPVATNNKQEYQKPKKTTF